MLNGNPVSPAPPITSLRLRFGGALRDEALDQHPHRRDRLNSDQREVAEHEGRVAERRETVGLPLVLRDPRRHPLLAQVVGEARGFHPAALGQSGQQAEIRDIQPILECGAEHRLVVGREGAGLALVEAAEPARLALPVMGAARRSVRARSENS
jgi:hypothetical protein